MRQALHLDGIERMYADELFDAVARAGAGGETDIESGGVVVARITASGQAAVKYHCYIEYRESVYTSDVEADSPVTAAAMAAAENHIHGRWTVVPGEPVYVDVVERRTYEAAPAGPES